MFEHATLQEAYTGALIAGKGKYLNNINIIMDRAKMPTADWVRVRFGAGTPWRRCWCVITPPHEKEVQKLQKQLNKKKSAYDRSRPPILKGDIKFYDSKKTKKVPPIASISDAYSAFAIYPQSKPLIDASTLVKVEGAITIHSNPPSTSEGFVFVMPEAHPAVSGFEIMLRWLFPVYDTFGLYGRPGRLIADTTDSRSLMFAMPKHRRYGYLEILDVSGLILESGSGSWKEGEWRKRMKELTAKRMTVMENGSQANSRYSSRRSTRNSFGPSRTRIQFDDSASVRSTPSHVFGSSQTDGTPGGILRTDSAPPGVGVFPPPKTLHSSHDRSVSETQSFPMYEESEPAAYDGAYEIAPVPPPHAVGAARALNPRYVPDVGTTPERVSSEDERVAGSTPVRELQELQVTNTPEPVATPPAFSHAPGSLPIAKPYQLPELRRENSRMSSATLLQLAGAAGVAGVVGYNAHGDVVGTSQTRTLPVDDGDRGVQPDANRLKESPANEDGLEGLLAASKTPLSFGDPSLKQPTDVDDTQTNNSPQSLQFSHTSRNPLPDSQVDSQTGAHPIPLEQPSLGRTCEPTQVSFVPNATNKPIGHGHNGQHSSDTTYSTVPQASRLQTSPSILRKPLPGTSNIQTPISAETVSSEGSLGQPFIDQDAFDMVGHDNQQYNMLSHNRISSHVTDRSSVYEDAESTTSPDYASTHQSVETRESIEKPRAGVMKTVGNVDGSSTRSSHIDIDFGPTLDLASNRSPSPGSSWHLGSGRTSPGPAQAFGARVASPGPVLNHLPSQGSPVWSPDSPEQSRSPSRTAITPENTHNRNLSSESRTMAWQPGMSVGGNTGKRSSITPEQFVQQRASMQPATPLFAHQRQQSSINLRTGTPTPPPGHRNSGYLANHSRNSSMDMLQRPGSRGAGVVLNSSTDLPQRPSSRGASVILNSPADLLQRPSSRGANVMLGSSGTGNIASALSAREQEQIAKMTGTPLISMAPSSKPQVAPAGLVGAIEAREREKQQIKQGINSTAVQNAIAQRQQQAMYEQQLYQEQLAAQFRMSQQYNSGMGQYPHQHPVQMQQQQTWVSPAAAPEFAQGGGWAPPKPSPGYVAPEQGRQSPSQCPPGQQQYFSPQQGAQGRGNGGAGYHGHAN